MSTEHNEAEDRFAGPRMGRLARVLALTGGGILLALSMLVTTSVGLAHHHGAGIDGDFEVVQLGAAIAAFCLSRSAFDPREHLRRYLHDEAAASLECGARWPVGCLVRADFAGDRCADGRGRDGSVHIEDHVDGAGRSHLVGGGALRGAARAAGITALVVGYRMLSGKAAGGEA